MDDMNNSAKRILLTGATGYVGGRLLKELEAHGYAVRCLTRRASALAGRVAAGTEIIEGDASDPAVLSRALAGVDIAYYLIHAMGSDGSFEEEETRTAGAFAAAARACAVGRIIYLGGLSGASEALSPHLRSRNAVGRILRESGVPTTEFQASIIIGSGSLSFELIRNLVDRLPVMLTPRWVHMRAQPIFIDDVLSYLVQAAASSPAHGSFRYEIGGADVTSYSGIMAEYAHARRLRRWMLPVPFLTPGLSSLWLNLITPVYARIGRKLIESIRHPSVVRDDSALRDFSIRPIGIREAIERTLSGEERNWNLSRWSDSLSSVGAVQTWGGLRFGHRIVDVRSVTVPAPPAEAFAPIRRIGGTRGWYFGTVLWRTRGWIDALVGGVGLRRGRRDPDNLRAGDALDFWRVEEYERDRRVRLLAEMKLPGRAWLEFEVEELPGGATVRQTAIFDPLGLTGQIYWYALYPVHALIFRGMLRAIAREVRSTPRK
jgi:uncharacterized protein YbjT (DUF2867 family)